MRDGRGRNGGQRSGSDGGRDVSALVPQLEESLGTHTKAGAEQKGEDERAGDRQTGGTHKQPGDQGPKQGKGCRAE